MSNKSESLAWQVAFFVAAGFLFVAAKASCSTTTEANDRAVQALERDGYTDATATGFRWYTCGGTLVSTGFDATAPSGAEHVTGAVCCGAVVRGCSIRTD